MRFSQSGPLGAAARPSRTESSRSIATGVKYFCYYLVVREFRIARALVALICISLLLLCTAIGPSATHLQPAIPALVFCFFAVFTLSLLRVSDGDSTVQLISFLALHISRAPPLA